MQLKPVTTISGYTREQFTSEFLEPGIPVLIKDFIHPESEALKKWNYDYFRQEAGDVMVGVHNEENAHLDKATSQPAEKMKFGDYLDLIESRPTVRRLFLFNLGENPIAGRDSVELASIELLTNQCPGFG